MNRKGGSHLTLQDRMLIEKCLTNQMSCSQIASQLDKDERTISKEIKKRRTSKENGRYKLKPHNLGTETCKTITRFPFVCNGCIKRQQCFEKMKYYYDANLAHNSYKRILSLAREGIDMTFDQKIEFDSVLETGIMKGQSPYHIAKSNPETITCSIRTMYRWIEDGKTTIQNVDLRRKVKLKPRKKMKQKNKDDLKVRFGRTYADFIRFYADNPGIGLVEIDTVEGPKEISKKCLLTIHFTATHFMMAYLLNSKEKDEVSKVFIYLQNILGKELYKKLFSIILTDRGTEFLDVERIEFFHDDGEKVSSVFFCDSYSSYQKGAIEENHTLIRYIIPKGTSMDDLSQKQIELMISNINSYERKSISSNPYLLMRALYGEDLLKKIRIEPINPNSIILKPKLLK